MSPVWHIRTESGSTAPSARAPAAGMAEQDGHDVSREAPVSEPGGRKHHGVNTFAYIRDMLVRVSTEPVSRVRELLPDRWKAERDAASREVAAAVRDPPA